MIERTWAVIVNWNGGAQANLECVGSLVAEGLDAERIIFVDNASDDGSPEAVLSEWPDVRLLRNETNKGYGAGSNRGLEQALQAGARFVCLVNNDVTFSAGTLPRLISALDESPQVGILGPRVLYKREPHLIWCAGGRITFRQNLSEMIGHRKPDGPAFRTAIDVDYVPGCAMLIRREVLERIGLMDGEYFAYHEDVEYCMQAVEAGFGVRMIGDVCVYHDAHHSTGGGYNARRKYMMAVNTVWFLRRHGTPLRWLSFFFFDVLSLPLVWLLRAPRGEGAAVLAKARGTWDGLRGRRVSAESVKLDRNA